MSDQTTVDIVLSSESTVGNPIVETVTVIGTVPIGPRGIDGVGGGGGAPDDATYLVATAHADLSAEVVVGATPGGELGGTWASPTVDATHSGSSHAAVQAAAEATAAAALATHAADSTAIHGIADTSALETTTGAQAKVDAHVNDTSDAHDASAVSYNGSAGLSATDVEAALDELDTEKQPLDADLSALAAANNSGVLAATTASFLTADETKLDGIEAGADVTDAANVNAAGAVMESDYDANTILAADSDNTPAPLTMGASTILARLAAGNIKAATPAELRTLLALVIGTNVQAWDADLDAIAALAASNDDIVQRKAGAWVNRTMAQLIADLAALGTTFQPLHADLTDLVARWVAASASGPASLAFPEDTDNGSNTATITAPAALGADRTLTLPDASGTLLTSAAADAAYAPKALGGVFYSAGALLTDTTPNSTAGVQWGTEEAVIAQADAPTSAVVVAWLTGDMVPGPAPAIGDRGGYTLQVSFDGGGSWASIGIGVSGEQVATLFTTTGGRACAITTSGRATGTVTGDIQVRALVRDVGAANDVSFRAGYITCIVHPQ